MASPSPLDNCQDLVKSRELDFVVKYFDGKLETLNNKLDTHNDKVEEMYKYYIQKKTEDKLKGGMIKAVIAIAGAIAGAWASGAR